MTHTEDLDDDRLWDADPNPEMVHWQPSHRPDAVKGARATLSPAAGLGMIAIGSVAAGALAFGALAIGAVAIGVLAVGRARIRRLEIDELIVGAVRFKE